MTKQEIINELLAMYTRKNGVPTRQEFLTYSDAKGELFQFWNSYNDLVVEAGLTPNRILHGIREKDVLISLYKKLWKESGKQPTLAQFKKGCRVNTKEIQETFGTFNSLVEAAGGVPRNSSKTPWTKERIEEALLKDIIEQDIPSTGTMFAKKHRMGYQCISYNYNSYADLLSTLLKPEEVLKITSRKKRRKEPVGKIIIRTDYSKRYPVKFNSTPVVLKWMRRRNINTKIIS